MSDLDPPSLCSRSSSLCALSERLHMDLIRPWTMRRDTGCTRQIKDERDESKVDEGLST
jgi:hypothetical protein